jgi:competence protein ComEC
VIRKFTVKIKQVKLTRRIAANDQQLRLGRYVMARMFVFPNANNENDRSTVLLVNYGKYRLLLTGDLGSEGEAFLAEKYPQLFNNAAVLKVGHHGSDYASTWAMLSQVKPQIGVISVGTDNRYGHPGPSALNRLHSLGTAVYRTDRQGTVSLRIYPDRVLVIPER